jgi:hypothetical protein
MICESSPISYDFNSYALLIHDDPLKKSLHM